MDIVQLGFIQANLELYLNSYLHSYKIQGIYDVLHKKGRLYNSMLKDYAVYYPLDSLNSAFDVSKLIVTFDITDMYNLVPYTELERQQYLIKNKMLGAMPKNILDKTTFDADFYIQSNGYFEGLKNKVFSMYYGCEFFILSDNRLVKYYGENEVEVITKLKDQKFFTIVDALYDWNLRKSNKKNMVTIDSNEINKAYRICVWI